MQFSFARLRKRVFQIVRPAGTDDRTSRLFDLTILALIALSVLCIILESVASIRQRFGTALRVCEIVTVCVFTLEYMLRLWACVEDRRFRHALRGRLRHGLSPMAVIDILAILPFYLPFVGVDLRFVRSIRLLRLFRVAKMGRYSAALQTLGRVVQAKKAELMITGFVLILLLIMGSSIMYYAEREAQPDVFTSIPAAMWWAVCTLTTVGYGDVFPVTAWGRLAGSVIAILGIGMFALPTGILGAAFVEEIQNRKHQRKPKTHCPHCGEELTE
jgi:voltage-gated potassium channel